MAAGRRGRRRQATGSTRLVQLCRACGRGMYLTHCRPSVRALVRTFEPQGSGRPIRFVRGQAEKDEVQGELPRTRVAAGDVFGDVF
jgi:hypothetical protein